MPLFQAVVVALIALAIVPGQLFYFDVTPKVALLLAGTAIALFQDARPRPALRLFTVLVLLDLASLGASTLFSVDPELSAFGTNWRRFGAISQAAVLLFAWIVAHSITAAPKRVRIILRGVAISSAIAGAYGIAQYFGWDPVLPANAYHIGGGIWTIVRPPGTMGYVSYFATWLVVAAFLGAELSRMEDRTIWRWIALASAAISVVAMLLTGTRAAMLALVAGLLVWLYYGGFVNFVGQAFSPALLKRTALLSLTALAVLAAFYFSPAGQQMRSRTKWYVEDPWGGARPLLWRDSLKMAATRLPLGYGPEIFTASFPHYESPALARAYPDFLHESPHNIFLDALVSRGLPGLGLLVAFCVVAFRSATRATAGLAAAFAAALVSQQFTVFIIPTAMLFYLTLALLLGVSADDPPAPRRAVPFRVVSIPVAVVLIYIAARYTIADRELALAQRNLRAGDLASTTAHYDRYLRWHLPGSSADIWYSRALLDFAAHSEDPLRRFQAVAQSGVAGQRATRTAEDPVNAWYSLAVVYGSQNNAAAAERCLRSAIAANPNWFKPHWTLAQILNLEHRTAEAEKEAALATDLDGGKNPEVAATLAQIREGRK